MSLVAFEQCYYLASSLDTSLVLDLDASGNVVVNKRGSYARGQWWSFLASGQIRNCLTGLVLTCGQANAQLDVAPGGDNDGQIWTYNADLTISNTVPGLGTLVVDDEGASTSPGNPVIGHVANGGTNQQWQVVAAEQAVIYRWVVSAVGQPGGSGLFVLQCDLDDYRVSVGTNTCVPDRLWVFTPEGTLRLLAEGLAAWADGPGEVSAVVENPQSQGQNWSLDATGRIVSQQGGQTLCLELITNYKAFYDVRATVVSSASPPLTQCWWLALGCF